MECCPNKHHTTRTTEGDNRNNRSFERTRAVRDSQEWPKGPTSGGPAVTSDSNSGVLAVLSRRQVESTPSAKTHSSRGGPVCPARRGRLGAPHPCGDKGRLWPRPSPRVSSSLIGRTSPGSLGETTGGVRGTAGYGRLGAARRTCAFGMRAAMTTGPRAYQAVVRDVHLPIHQQ